MMEVVIGGKGKEMEDDLTTIYHQIGLKCEIGFFPEIGVKGLEKSSQEKSDVEEINQVCDNGEDSEDENYEHEDCVEYEFEAF